MIVKKKGFILNSYNTLVISEDQIWEINNDTPQRTIPITKVLYIVCSSDHPGDFIIHPAKDQDMHFIDDTYRDQIVHAL